MYLLDTNCFIQLVRNRPDAPQVRAMLDGVPTSRLFVTTFTLHSIGVIMSRFGQIAGYLAFIRGLGIGEGIRVIQLQFHELQRVADVSLATGLDFDDAYQYAAAELHGLRVVSLDADFDRIPDGRLTPADALRIFTEVKRT